MSVGSASLERECVTFTRLMAGSAPNAFLIAKYVSAHQVSAAFTSQDTFDAWIIRVARMAPILARVADAYARHFAPHSVLRRKLILVLALIETLPPYHRGLSANSERSLGSIVSVLVASGIIGVAATALGVMLFAPLHLIARLVGNQK